jgi:hypothetical protein
MPCIGAAHVLVSDLATDCRLTLVYVASLPCRPSTAARVNSVVRWGSSPYVSEPRPQRGSRKIFIWGVQHVRNLHGTRVTPRVSMHPDSIDVRHF